MVMALGNLVGNPEHELHFFQSSFCHIHLIRLGILKNSIKALHQSWELSSKLVPSFRLQTRAFNIILIFCMVPCSCDHWTYHLHNQMSCLQINFFQIYEGIWTNNISNIFFMSICSHCIWEITSWLASKKAKCRKRQILGQENCHFFFPFLFVRSSTLQPLYIDRYENLQLPRNKTFFV